ncbi:MAG: hypothetical protein HY689_02620 [Chloroflexi bacterium]|nr:hypothetical protein [Chloroflexota bacterium]
MGRLRADIEARRTRVAELLLEGRSEREMARALGVSLGTVATDVKAVRQEWQARRLAHMEEKGAEDLARTDADLAAIWPKVRAGNLWAIDRVLGLLQYRAKVLGLEAPQKQEHDVGDALAAILERLAPQGSPADQ